MVKIVVLTLKYNKIRNMMQSDLFNSVTTDKLKRGTERCACCGRMMRAYNKTLDERLVLLAYECYDWMKTNNHQSFNPKVVFNGDHNKINDFQKLGYFEIVKRTDSAGWWKITMKGYQFLTGTLDLPRNVWVFNRRIIEVGNELVGVDTVYPRWQVDRSDYTLDYIIKDPDNFKQ